MRRFLITGITGFVGRALSQSLAGSENYFVRGAVREINNKLHSNVEQIVTGDLSHETNWSKALSNVSVVIHLAARVHIMNDTSLDPLTEFRKINTSATLNLARQASIEGVDRFIYLSSIKVNGEETFEGSSFTLKSNYTPSDPYALSKYEAEQGLKKLATETAMEIVIIRPPLIYGAGVGANFDSMMVWLSRGIPLPLGSINNKRSLIALDNLVDFITLCVDHPKAANQVFLVSDDEDLSTTELLQRMGEALGQPSRLVSIPTSFVLLAASFLGKKNMAKRLCGSLQIDMSHTKEILCWKPPISVDVALQQTADDFLKKLKESQ